MTTKSTPVSAGRTLRAGDRVELEFSDLLANGQAVGRSGGVVVFCFGPLPGERARVRITSIKPKYAVGEMLELTKVSPWRVQPFCAVFGVCGGCQVQHLAYPQQLAWKREVVRSALQRIGGFDDAAVRETMGMDDPRAYRNKMSLVVSGPRRSGIENAPVLGFYKQRSHDLVPIDACPIVMPALNAHIAVLNEALRASDSSPALRETLHIVERTAKTTQQTVVTFTTAQRSEDLRRVSPNLIRRLPGTVGMTNSYELGSENAILGRKHQLLCGEPQIEEHIDGVRYRVSAGSFFQVNVEIVGKIFDFIRGALGVPRSVVDLYCGAGTFSLYFAKLRCRVVGVEENAQAIEEARKNAALNQLEGTVRFVGARVEQAVQRPDVSAALRAAHIVFLDPPRKGSDEMTLDAVARSAVPNIWYLSCDPATLARDLRHLSAKGYSLGTVQPFDMFPQTGHVEVFATMHAASASPAAIIR